MPKFLIKANYTAEGMKGLQKDKASGREKAIAAACKSVGGKLDAVYYALGDDDVFVIVDLPSHVQVSSLCIAVGASGMANTRTVSLLTVAEMDKALSEGLKYRPAVPYKAGRFPRVALMQLARRTSLCQSWPSAGKARGERMSVVFLDPSEPIMANSSSGIARANSEINDSRADRPAFGTMFDGAQEGSDNA